MDTIAPKQRIISLFGKYKYPILVVLVGLGLMLLPEPSEAPAEPVPATAESEPNLEQRLEALLSAIEGAGQVRVLLTVDAGRETLYQTDSRVQSDEGSSERSDDTVLVEDADRVESGLVRQVLEPKYRGAVILCQGGDVPGVRLAVVEAVRCLTGLGADQISVLKMK